MTDLLKQLGTLSFATRLRRLGEWLQRDVTRIYAEQKLPFEARWFPVMQALKSSKPRSITELAVLLGFTHPAVNQITSSMARKGMLESLPDKNDDRRRLVRLTPKGRRLIAELEPIWRLIKQETDDLILEGAEDVLSSLNRLEKALEANSMYRRLSRRLKNLQYERIQIADYQPRYKAKFSQLNYEWLKEYFSVEPIDRKILSNPRKYILDPGGSILMAQIDGKVVGVVALLRHNNSVFEIAKMAVTKSARGRQVGRKLAHAALEKARKLKGKRVILFTSPVLKTALALYRSIGFREKVLPAECVHPYDRQTISMELELSDIMTDKSPITSRRKNDLATMPNR